MYRNNTMMFNNDSTLIKIYMSGLYVGLLHAGMMVLFYIFVYICGKFPWFCKHDKNS